MDLKIEKIKMYSNIRSNLQKVQSSTYLISRNIRKEISNFKSFLLEINKVNQDLNIPKVAKVKIVIVAKIAKRVKIVVKIAKIVKRVKRVIIVKIVATVYIIRS